MEWLQFDPKEFLVNLLKVMIAFLLALPIAWEREKSTKVIMALVDKNDSLLNQLNSKF